MKIEEELRSALREHAPTDEERAAWVRAALDDVARREPPKRPNPIWLLAATAAVLALLLIPRFRRSEPAPPPRAELAGDAADERARNLAMIEKSRTDWTKQKGKYIAVVGGDSLQIGPDAAAVVAWADKLYPEAKHRFVFRIDGSKPPYDVVADRSPVHSHTVGMWFLQQAGIKLAGEPGDWTFTRGKKSWRSKRQKPVLTLRVFDRTVDVVVFKESLCPLMLPKGMAFPLYETPGDAIYEGMDRKWRSFRRYLVHVRHAALGLDSWVDAAGDRHEGPIAPGNVFAVRLGGHVFQALKVDPAEVARREKKPVLVLELRDKDTERLNKLFSVDIEGYAQKFVPGRESSVMKRYAKDGRLMAKLDLSRATADQLRNFLKP